MNPAPPASLLGLPAELKIHIVDLVWRQDEAYKARREAAAGRALDSASESWVDVPGYGKSLHALREVNKELASLGATHLFSVRPPVDSPLPRCFLLTTSRLQTISASRAVDPIFRYPIGTLYAGLVQSIVFGTRLELAACAQIVGSLVLFTNLRELHFEDEEIMDNILGPDWVETAPDGIGRVLYDDPDYAYSSAALKAATSRIRKIGFGRLWSSSQAGLLLAFFPAIKSVRFHNFVVDDSVAHARGDLDTSLSATVQSLVGLEELEVYDPVFEGPGWVSPLWQRHWRSSGTLRSIRIQTQRVYAALWQMVKSLGDSLETLKLHLTIFDEDFETDLSKPTPSTTPASFPRLKCLTIDRNGNFETPITLILSRLKSAPILDLTIDILTSAALTPVLNQFPTLQRLTLLDLWLEDGDRLAGEEHHKIAVECAARSIELRIESFGVTPKRVTDLVPDETPEEDAALALNLAAVRRTLEFGLLRLERARVDKDVNWDIEASMLAPLEQLRLAWED
ncbi:hypothetical protein RQP46_009511 [Phenoliferia psychrophenolica]